ncbi:MAG: hypothetical protein JW894_05810 [Bacteroidales bacterium]|nr:hypothetical protein [Bacteroidales bacterium]
MLELEHKKLGTELDTREKELAKINMQYAQQNAKLFAIRDQVLDIMPNASRENYKKLIQLRKSIENDLNNSESWKQFETSINITNDNFLQRITEKYKDITHNDLKLIAYIRMNLDNKEIADLLNITLRSVESSRYRLRKKMELDKNMNLNDYIIRF